MTVAKPTANTNISISYLHTCSNLHIITNGDTIRKQTNYFFIIRFSPQTIVVLSGMSLVITQF